MHFKYIYNFLVLYLIIHRIIHVYISKINFQTKKLKNYTTIVSGCQEKSMFF